MVEHPLIELLEAFDGIWVFQLCSDFFAGIQDQLLAVAQITMALQRLGRRVIKHGKGSGSLETEQTAGLDYTVVTGDLIRTRISWLYSFYWDESIISAYSAACGRQLSPSTDEVSAINLNGLKGKGCRYERHVDGQGFSAVLMISDLITADGGNLVIYPESGPPRSFQCVFGRIVLFEGSRLAHEVLPLESDRQRITVPMVYLPPGVTARPSSLDDYLYQGDQ